jgi:hypothetical protein
MLDITETSPHKNSTAALTEPITLHIWWIELKSEASSRIFLNCCLLAAPILNLLILACTPLLEWVAQLEGFVAFLAYVASAVLSTFPFVYGCLGVLLTPKATWQVRLGVLGLSIIYMTLGYPFLLLPDQPSLEAGLTQGYWGYCLGAYFALKSFFPWGRKSLERDAK